VIGNFIGTDVTGRVAFGNRDDGVFIHGAQQNLVGGRTAGEGNVISGNGRWGVNLWGMGVMSNTVIGNYIGTNAIGTAAIGNTQHGVVIGDSAEGNLIGGIGTGEGNLISGNEGDGVSVENSHRNIVAGNYIGMDASGVSTLGNRGAGVSIHDGSQHNTVGPGNMIAYNADAGIPINGATTLSNTITANAIHSHSGKGIVLANGGNNMLPAPVITTVTATAVSGTACPGCTVEVFSDAEDEGRIYEGSAVANAAGAFTFAKPAGLTGPFVTATATDQDGNTSEFSAAQRVSRKQIYLPMILKGQ
jgi:parallel beta-helix repeat protein